MFLLSLPAVTTRLYASDEIEYFAYLRSVWFDRDLRFENEYRYFYDRGIARDSGFKATFLDASTATGHQPNYGPVGTAILWAPFYLAADGGVRAARWLGADVPADGFSRPYIAAIAYGSALYGFLAIVLSGFAARRIAGKGVGTPLAVWVGTPLLFYMYVAPGFSHAASAFSVAAFVAAWLVVRRNWSWGGVAALGALAAVMGMVREQDLFIAVGPALDYVVTAARSISSGLLRPAGRRVHRALRPVRPFPPERPEDGVDVAQRLARAGVARERPAVLDAAGAPGARRPRVHRLRARGPEPGRGGGRAIGHGVGRSPVPADGGH